MRLTRRSLVYILLLLGLALAACNSITGTITPTPPGDNILFTDNFSAVQPGWALFDTPEGAAYVQQGELYLEDRGRGVGIYTHLVNREWNDTLINVRLRQIEGSQDNWMGVICRQQDEENYYLFAISADGYYLILKVEGGIPTQLAGPTRDEIINTGRGSNQITARCAGQSLSLTVNDKVLATVDDDSFETGNTALFADAVAPGGRTTVAFDALVISGPEEIDE